MNLLLVEDEAAIAEPIVAGFKRHGFAVTWVRRARQADEVIVERPPDLMVIDVNLLDGEEAGFELLGRVREMELTVPVLMLTARDAVEDRVLGLEGGADDYLAKPFAFAELLARVRALLRRVSQIKENQFKRGTLEVDFSTHEARLNAQVVPLTAREFAVLELLARSPERVFRPDEVLERVWGEETDNLGVVRVYVHYLRQKLGEGVVEKVSGGYRLGSA